MLNDNLQKLRKLGAQQKEYADREHDRITAENARTLGTQSHDGPISRDELTDDYVHYPAEMEVDNPVLGERATFGPPGGGRPAQSSSDNRFTPDPTAIRPATGVLEEEHGNPWANLQPTQPFTGTPYTEHVRPWGPEDDRTLDPRYTEPSKDQHSVERNVLVLISTISEEYWWWKLHKLGMLECKKQHYIEAGGTQRQLISKQPFMDDDGFAHISVKFSTRAAVRIYCEKLANTEFTWGDMGYKVHIVCDKPIQVRRKTVPVKEGCTVRKAACGSRYHRIFKIRGHAGLVDFPQVLADIDSGEVSAWPMDRCLH